MYVNVCIYVVYIIVVIVLNILDTDNGKVSLACCTYPLEFPPLRIPPYIPIGCAL